MKWVGCRMEDEWRSTHTWLVGGQVQGGGQVQLSSWVVLETRGGGHMPCALLRTWRSSVDRVLLTCFSPSLANDAAADALGAAAAAADAPAAAAIYGSRCAAYEQPGAAFAAVVCSVSQ